MIYRGKDSLAEALKSGALKGVDVDTSVYKKAHGKDPHGRGAWIFSVSPSVDPAKEEEGKDYVLTVTDSYDSAVKKAKEWARKQKKSKIYLMEGEEVISETVVLEKDPDNKARVKETVNFIVESLKPKKPEWMKSLDEEKNSKNGISNDRVEESEKKKDLSGFEKTLVETLKEANEPIKSSSLRPEYGNIVNRFKRK